MPYVGAAPDINLGGRGTPRQHGRDDGRGEGVEHPNDVLLLPRRAQGHSYSRRRRDRERDLRPEVGPQFGHDNAESTPNQKGIEQREVEPATRNCATALAKASVVSRVTLMSKSLYTVTSDPCLKVHKSGMSSDCNQSTNQHAIKLKHLSRVHHTA